MKNTIRKLAAIIILASLVNLAIAPIQIAFAADDGPKSTAEKNLDNIPDCIEYNPDAPDLRLQVILEEALDSGKTVPKSSELEPGTEIRKCYRVTLCEVKEVNDTLNFIKDASNKKVKKAVCTTQLKAKCPDEYKTGFAEIDTSKTDTNGSKMDTSKYCQRVQVLLTNKGGAGLIYLYVGTIYRWAASIIGIIAVLIIIINGIIISASTGDSQAVTGAKDRIIQGLIAIAILFLSALILNTINPNFFT